jgi:hypothetical protein
LVNVIKKSLESINSFRVESLAKFLLHYSKGDPGSLL